MQPTSTNTPAMLACSGSMCCVVARLAPRCMGAAPPARTQSSHARVSSVPVSSMAATVGLNLPDSSQPSQPNHTAGQGRDLSVTPLHSACSNQPPQPLYPPVLCPLASMNAGMQATMAVARVGPGSAQAEVSASYSCSSCSTGGAEQ